MGNPTQPEGWSLKPARTFVRMICVHLISSTVTETLCQALLDAGHSQSHRIIASDILPDHTTIARRVNSLADGKRLEFIEMLKVDLQNAKLFGITCGYWKNKYSCESYLTINMHYGKKWTDTEFEDILLNRNEEHFLDNTDHTLAKEVADLLSTFKIGGELLSADDTPTLHLVLPFVKKFKQCYVTRNSEKLATKKLKGILLQKLDEKIWLSETLSLLAIPASSAKAERIFSETGRILEARRQLLSPESVDSLVFLRNFNEN
ncbi:unnamed protein product [Didymodactylos carnosus]|uniref:HAT C-terminal dimerisation domain-containing protein n=1 Tax=Didymodactylos carnosus TaxID=1234261 RepID=A0A814W3A4_9BILA|nr:unnamed protein product [Didymodactylos carnosus]CAF1195650.1 unnamed protein product [Didymodactylos carnosus]CAF3712348.1 unnamed protein product [Didymodactylos carnosus]CAF3960068.1 unnamed protein product [Didymodactylos carnosus]